MSTFPYRLAQARTQRGMTQTDLAEAASRVAGDKINQSTIGMLESGERKKTTYILALAAALHVEPMWLQYGKGSREITRADADAYGAAHNDGPQMVPLLGTASCGAFREVLSDLDPAAEMVAAPMACGPHSFMTEVDGLSMYNPGGVRSYKPGDRVLFDCDRSPEIGKAVIARLPTGECTMKCYQRDGAVEFLLALNPEWDERRTPIPDGTEIIATEVVQLVT